MESTYAVTPNWGEAQLRLFNGRNCNYQLNTNLPGFAQINLYPFGYFQENHIQIDGESSTFTYSLSSSNCPGDAINAAEFILNGSMATSFHFSGQSSLIISPYEDSPEKSRRGWPLITVLGNLQSNNALITFVEESSEEERYNQTSSFREQVDIQATRYNILIDNVEVGKMELRLGGVYTLMITQTVSSHHIELIIITEPNSLSIYLH